MTHDPSTSGRKALILNVDDDSVARYARNRLLRNAGYDVVDASTGSQALASLGADPQLVILDVGLPDIDGFEVCRRIKAQPETAAVAVLQVSASFVRGEDRTRALEGGADNFLIEPVEPEVLVATVGAMLRMQRAEQELRSSARAWEATFDAIDEGVALLDPSERVVRCNEALSRLLAMPRERIVGELWSSLVASDGPVGEGASEESGPVSRRGGRHIQSHRTPVTGGRERAVAVVRDVTDHVVALDAAREANRLKDEFLAVLSHELRTPLNAIVGWAHMLETGRLDAAATERAVQAIRRNAQVQSKLISDILDVSRIIAGKLQLERNPVELDAVVESALETIRPAALARAVRIDMDASPGLVVEGEPARLQQVVWNLLSNAIKFSPRGGSVQVTLRGEGEDVELVVRDMGPGIQPAFLPFVFDRFRQADSSTTRSKGGLGLGLAIVRHIVELHGGTVSAANGGDRPGAVFTVRLPRGHAVPVPRRAVKAIDAAAARAAPAPEPLLGRHVLIVDDEGDARELIATVLGSAGAVVTGAATVDEAIALAARQRYDAILSDLEMPGEDGYSMLRRIRELPDGRGAIPAAALTAYASSEDHARVLRAGFAAHIVKPVTPVDLIEAVAALLLPPAPGEPAP